MNKSRDFRFARVRLHSPRNAPDRYRVVFGRQTWDFEYEHDALILSDRINLAFKETIEEVLNKVKTAVSDAYCPCMKDGRECADDFEIYWKNNVIDKINYFKKDKDK